MSLLDWFLPKKTTQQRDSLIKEITDMGDKWFTSDAERKTLQAKLEALAAMNPHPFVSGGRSAIMWSMAAVVLYQTVVREILIIGLGIANPPNPGIDIEQFIAHLLKLLVGTL